MSELGDGPVGEKYLKMMNDVAMALDEAFNGRLRGKDRTTGFVLLVFPFGDADEKSRCNFISNGADRRDIVALFKEMIARFEEQPEVSGHG